MIGVGGWYEQPGCFIPISTRRSFESLQLLASIARGPAAAEQEIQMATQPHAGEFSPKSPADVEQRGK
jgi:hypothetical protein